MENTNTTTLTTLPKELIQIIINFRTKNIKELGNLRLIHTQFNKAIFEMVTLPGFKKFQERLIQNSDLITKDDEKNQILKKIKFLSGFLGYNDIDTQRITQNKMILDCLIKGLYTPEEFERYAVENYHYVSVTCNPFSETNYINHEEIQNILKKLKIKSLKVTKFMNSYLNEQKQICTEQFNNLFKNNIIKKLDLNECADLLIPDGNTIQELELTHCNNICINENIKELILHQCENNFEVPHSVEKLTLDCCDGSSCHSMKMLNTISNLYIKELTIHNGLWASCILNSKGVLDYINKGYTNKIIIVDEQSQQARAYTKNENQKFIVQLDKNGETIDNIEIVNVENEQKKTNPTKRRTTHQQFII